MSVFQSFDDPADDPIDAIQGEALASFCESIEFFPQGRARNVFGGKKDLVLPNTEVEDATNGRVIQAATSSECLGDLRETAPFLDDIVMENLEGNVLLPNLVSRHVGLDDRSDIDPTTNPVAVCKDEVCRVKDRFHHFRIAGLSGGVSVPMS